MGFVNSLTKYYINQGVQELLNAPGRNINQGLDNTKEQPCWESNFESTYVSNLLFKSQILGTGDGVQLYFT